MLSSSIVLDKTKKTTLKVLYSSSLTITSFPEWRHFLGSDAPGYQRGSSSVFLVPLLTGQHFAIYVGNTYSAGEMISLDHAGGRSLNCGKICCHRRQRFITFASLDGNVLISDSIYHEQIGYWHLFRHIRRVAFVARRLIEVELKDVCVFSSKWIIVCLSAFQCIQLFPCNFMVVINILQRD